MPKITELPPVQNINKEDILLVIQNDTSKSAQAQLLKGSHEHDVEDIDGIEEKIEEIIGEKLSKLVKKAGDTLTGPLNGPSANFNALSAIQVSATSGVFSGSLIVNGSGSFQNSLKIDDIEVSKVGHYHNLSSEIIADAGAQAYLFNIFNINDVATELDEQNVGPGILYYSKTSQKLKVNLN